MKQILYGFLLLSALGGPAAAQTVLQLAATGTALAPPDEITASLTVQDTAATANAAQNKVNAAMKQALAAARATQGVAATTEGYVQDTSAKQNGTQFQASQTLDLTMPAGGGTPPDAFTALLGKLQSQNLQLNGLDGALSATGRAQAQNQAISDAITRLQNQAATIARTLGQHVGTIKTLNISTDNAGPVMPMRMMAMAPAAAPQAAPGPVTVSASISGEIDLVP